MYAYLFIDAVLLFHFVILHPLFFKKSAAKVQIISELTKLFFNYFASFSVNLCFYVNNLNKLSLADYLETVVLAGNTIVNMRLTMTTPCVCRPTCCPVRL